MILAKSAVQNLCVPLNRVGGVNVGLWTFTKKTTTIMKTALLKERYPNINSCSPHNNG